MAVAGTLEIQLLANMARLQTDMNIAKSTVTSAMSGIESAVSSAKTVLAGLGLGLSVVSFVNMIKGSIDAMDHLHDLSKSTGLTVEALAGLKVAAKQSGGDLDSIAASVTKLSVEMGKAPEKFRALGISATDPLEAFKQLADIFNAIEDPQLRNAVAATALGKSWAGAAPLLAEGSRKIGEMIEVGARQTGITTEQAKKADELNDKWLLLVGTGGLWNRVAASMLDPLLQITNRLNRATEASDNWYKSLWKFANTPPPATAVVRAFLGLGDDPTGGMKLGSGPSGGRANTTRIQSDDAAEAAKKLLGLDKTVQEARRRNASEDEQWNKEMFSRQLIASEQAKAKELKDATELADHLAKISFDSENKQKAASDAILQAHIDEGASVAESLNIVTEFEQQAYAQRLTDMNLFFETSNLTIAEQNALREALKVDHEARLTSIEDAAIKKRYGIANVYRKIDLDSASFFFNALAGMMTSKSREMFEIGKAAAIAGAVVDTYRAATGAYAALASIPIVGPALGAAAAAAAIVAGLANVQAISAAKMGGSAAIGTFAASPTTGLPVVGPTGAPQGGGQSTIINLVGDTFGRKQVKALVEAINENSKDGGRVVFA